MILSPHLRSLLAIVAAPATWFLHFSALYAGATLLCTGRIHGAGFGTVATIGTVMALGVLGILFALLFRGRESDGANDASQFLVITGTALILLAAAGIVWTYAPAMTLGCETSS